MKTSVGFQAVGVAMINSSVHEHLEKDFVVLLFVAKTREKPEHRLNSITHNTHAHLVGHVQVLMTMHLWTRHEKHFAR